MDVLEDTTTKVPAEEAKDNCIFIRRYKVEYRYPTPQPSILQDGSTVNHDHIYYLVLQCQNAEKKKQGEKVYFSYTVNGDFAQLPVGCPPPPIELPEEKNPCADGYQIGNVISNTVAKIITPRFDSSDPAINPILDTPQYKEIERLKKEFKETDNANNID